MENEVNELLKIIGLLAIAYVAHSGAQFMFALSDQHQRDAAAIHEFHVAVDRILHPERTYVVSAHDGTAVELTEQQYEMKRQWDEMNAVQPESRYVVGTWTKPTVFGN
jgi:hypothetical protein